MSELLNRIYAELGGDKGRYLGVSYGLSDANSLEKLLQTPNLWGHNPTNRNYVPAAGNLREAIREMVSKARETVDIASLAKLPNGLFLDSIRDGLVEAAKINPHLIVRILVGRAPTHSAGDFDKLVAGLTQRINTKGGSELAVPRTVPIYVAAMKSNVFSWNHAKLIIIDGKRAIAGGHNLWSDDYCGIAPIHDVSILLSGPAVRVAENFLNLLWTSVASYSRRTSSTGTDQNARLWWNGTWHENALPLIKRRQQIATETGSTSTGTAGQVLAVARLGQGIVFSSKDSNASHEARLIAARLAKKSIKLSLQALDNSDSQVDTWWAEDYIQVLAEAVVKRDVEIWIVIADAGAKGGYCGSGIQKTGVELHAQIIKEVQKIREPDPKRWESKRRSSLQKVHLAPLRFYPNERLPEGSNEWKWQMEDGSRIPPGNHAKVYIVDDEIFYVGSDNAYPIYRNPLGLQEFGFLASTGSTLWQPMSEYWNSLWSYSRWAQVLLPGA